MNILKIFAYTHSPALISFLNQHVWKDNTTIPADGDNALLGDGSIGQKISEAILRFAGAVRYVGTPIAVIAIIFCAVKMLIASDPGSVKIAKTWLLTIAVALVIMWVAPTLVSSVVHMLSETAG